MSGVELIQQERERQQSVEGWTPEHDDQHTDGEMALAAHGYLARSVAQIVTGAADHDRVPRLWPWDKEWWKPSDDPIRNLVKAGALIAAEIDRLQRAKETVQP